ncbi:MAG: glycosyltransferase [Deltaproteobacteria bacterium]|nr:glycosyltransferase [Deltaproteobacteria bacterium]
MSILKNISVVIPLAPGEKAYLDLLKDLEVLPHETEIILSTTEPLAEIFPKNIHVIHTQKGRAHQLNGGVIKASKDYLWFLHADSRISKKDISTLEKSLNVAPETLFYFNLKFYSGPIWMVLNTIGVWVRSHFLGIPFGDQGLCIQKSLFKSLGGFDEKVPFGEDHLFVWKAKKQGIGLKCTGGWLKTSARKYQRQGWFKTTVNHMSLTFKQAFPQYFAILLRSHKISLI